VRAPTAQIRDRQMIFSYFRTAEVIEFADSIVGEYDRLNRSTAVRHDTPDKRRQKFEKLAQKIDAYCRDQKLNFYKKSKLLYTIKEGLANKGITQADIDDLLGHLLAKGLQRPSS
jgi:hypothetical protein